MTTSNGKWFSVTLRYDAYYHQRVILQASTASRACDDAKATAESQNAWTYADDISETYVARIKAYDSEDDARASPLDLPDGATVPARFRGHADQVEQLLAANELLRAKAARLQEAVTALSQRTIVVTVEGGVIQAVDTNTPGSQPSVFIVDRDIEGAAADEITVIDGYGKGFVERRHLLLDAGYVAAVVEAAAKEPA
ncbi:MAG: hypothetical protein LCH93_16610 [Proteobacteria bacterium]|nr:hypothetical protein [Pseudomonadota bacterium]